MVEMKILSPMEAFAFLEDEPKANQLVRKMAQMLLEADLSVRLVNAALNSVWYTVLDTGKLKIAPEWRNYLGAFSPQSES